MKQQHLLSGASQPTRLPLQVPRESVEIDKPAQDGQLPLSEDGRRGDLVADAVLQFPNAQRGEQERFGPGKSSCGSEFPFGVGMRSGSNGAGAGTAASLGLRFTGAPIVVGRADGEFATIHN